MKEIKEWFKEMDDYEKRQAIQGLIAWGGLLVIVFMLSVIGG